MVQPHHIVVKLQEMNTGVHVHTETAFECWLLRVHTYTQSSVTAGTYFCLYMNKQISYQFDAE